MAYTKATKNMLVPKQGAITRKVDLPKFDLSQINVSQLAKDLSEMIHTPQPSGWLGKWWANKKLPMDNDRLMHLERYIVRVGAINDSITEMQYKLFIQPQVLQDLIEGYTREAEQKIERQIAEHKTYLNHIVQLAKRDDLETQKQEFSNEKLKQEAKLIGLQASLLDKIISEIDLSHITPEQAFVLVKALNPNAEASANFGVLEAQVAKMMAETDIKKQEAQQAAVQSRTDELNYEQLARRLKDNK